jgi:hypothetical protein
MQEPHVVTPFELRPLAIGELLDRVFSLYKRHLSTFVGIMAVPAVFNLLLALTMLIMQHVRGPLFAPPKPGDPFDPDMATVVEVGGIYTVSIVVYWITYMFALGASTVAVSEIYAGRDISVGGAFGRARPHLGRLLLLALLWFVVIVGPGAIMMGVGAGLMVGMRQSPTMVVGVLIMTLGALVLFATCIFLSLRYAVSAPALILEGASPWRSLTRSTFLTKGFLGRVFLLSFCAAMLAYTAVMLLQMPFNVASVVAGPTSPAGFYLALIGVFSGVIGQTLTAPIMVIGVAVLYYDFRVRKEALDLQVMMSALDSPNGGLSMTPPPSPALPH